MSAEENRSIIVKESAFLQKVGNQIAITNKLLKEEFDYIKWWDDLDDIWKDSFQSELLIINGKLKSKRNLSFFVYSHQEHKFIHHEASNPEFKMDSDLFKSLIEAKALFIGLGRENENHYIIENLKPLKLFQNLEKLIFINVEIGTIQALNSLKHLNFIEFAASKLNQLEIEKFKNEHFNCKVVLNLKEL